MVTAPDPVTLLEDCCTEEGASAFHEMSDGWSLHSETWMPNGPATTLLLHVHGWMESSKTIGVRRLAKMCKTRGIVLVALEPHGHGLSLERGGVARPAASRGQIDGAEGIADVHIVEVAKILLQQHRKPLVLMGHSWSATMAMFAARRCAEACIEAGVPFVCGVYLALPPSSAKASCPPCCTFSLLKSLSHLLCCVTALDSPNKVGLNPGLILGDDRNPTKMQWRNMCLNIFSPTWPPWDRVMPQVDGVPGRVFQGDLEEGRRIDARLAELKNVLPSTVSLEIFEGVQHDCLSADPQSVRCIRKVFDYIDLHRFVPAQQRMS